jgi:hypothetical protein
MTRTRETLVSLGLPLPLHLPLRAPCLAMC